MFASRNLRAAALGFGLSFTLAPPQPDGAIDILDAQQALACYRLALTAVAVRPLEICSTTVESLMGVRGSATLMAVRASSSLSPARTVAPFCEAS